MANNVLDWAIALKVPTVHKCALMIIADDADKAGRSHYLGTLNRFSGLASMSRRNLQRILRQLELWGVIRIYQQHRQTGSDTVHMFQCEIGIDPAEWTCPRTRPHSKQERYYVNLSEFKQQFWSVVVKRFLAEKTDPSYLETFIRPLTVVAVEKDRIVFKLPGDTFADTFHAEKSRLLEAAQQIQPGLKRIHVLPVK